MKKTIILLFLLLPFFSLAQSKKEIIESLNFRIDSLKSAIVNYKSIISEKEKKIGELNTLNSNKDDQIKSTDAKNESLVTKIESLQKSINSLQDSITAKNLQIKKLSQIKLPEDFSSYFNLFIKTYNARNKTISRFIKSDIGYYTTSNPGAFCSGGKSDFNSIPWCIDYSNVFCRGMQIDSTIPINLYNKIPKGDMCTGFQESSGFYYKESNYAESILPKIFNPETMSAAKFDIPPQDKIEKIMVVTIVSNSVFGGPDTHRLEGVLYFLKINNSWYFFCQSFCNCSA